MNKRYTYGYWLISMIIFLLQSCDVIDENNRFIEIQQVPANKTVLLIEFTDQRCVNCPAAAELIESLHEEYGEKLISVSMHANPIFNLPLETETSNYYENHFRVNELAHPAAMIDKKANLSILMNEWPTLVRNEIQNKAKVDINISTQLNDNSLTIYSSVRGIHLNEAESGKLHLQLWMVEDSIVSKQLMEDTQYNYEYLHRHVFRAAVNSELGENILIQTGEILNDTANINLNNNWNKSNLSVVGFVYSGDDFENILQTTQKKIQ